MNGSHARNALIVAAVVVGVAAVAVYRQQARRASNPIDATTTTQSIALPRMIDLGSDKCIPCKEMAPILAELRSEYAGRATIEFADVLKHPEVGASYEARVIPTQIFFDRDGKEVWRHEGFLSRKEIVAKLKELGAG